MQPIYVQVISIATLWLIFMWAVRFSATASRSLLPIGTAAWNIVARARSRAEVRSEWDKAIGKIYMTLNISLLKPWALVMLFGGMTLMGAGYGFGASGDIALLVSPENSTWLSFLDRYLDWTSAVFGCLGMAGCLAATSPRPTISALISLGFSVTGIGIGVTASLYF